MTFWYFHPQFIKKKKRIKPFLKQKSGTEKISAPLNTCYSTVTKIIL